MLNPDIPRRYAGKYPADVLDKLNLTYLNRRKGDPHIPWGMGFGEGKVASEISFEAVLDQLENAGQIAVYTAIYERAERTGVWPFLTYLRHAWNLAAGHGVSHGFQFTCDRPGELVEHLRRSPSFCCDLWPMNADHQTQNGQPCRRVTFREIVPGDTPGLHVCVVNAYFREFDAYGGPHDIHIDTSQIGCDKLNIPIAGWNGEAGTCFYRDIVGHARTAIPYFLEPYRSVLERNLREIIAGAGRLVEAGKSSREAFLHEVNRTLPMLPGPMAHMAAGWLDALVREWARRKTSLT